MFGLRRAALHYTLAAGVTGGIYFYRSNDGVNAWTLLNPGAPVMSPSGTFLDTDLDNSDKFTVPHYRGVVDPSGGPPETWLVGPAVGPYDYTSRRQVLASLCILDKEYRNMAHEKGDGVQAFHCIPLDSGEPVSVYDPDTGQILGPQCPETGSGEDGYGTPYQGGFYPPLQTWVKMIALDGKVRKTKREAMGSDEDADVVFRLLAYPRPERGHMIVLAKSDQRYLVGESINRHFFPGTTIPVAWECRCHLMDKVDPRARLEMPPLRPDPA